MADLNADLILQGTATTHPTMALTPQQNAQDLASVAQTQQQTQLEAQQSQGLAIQNQIQQNQLKTNSLIAQGMSNVARHVQSGNPTSTMPTANSTTPAAANTNADNSSVPYYLQANPDAPPPGQSNVLPIGVDPSWTVDKSLNGYRDSDGAPVPHSDAPPVTPNGSLNYHSKDVMDAAADDAVAHGADPFLVAQWRMEAEQKATKLDQERVGVYKDTADAQKALADSQEASQRAQTAQKNHVADTIDADLRSPNPISGLTQTLTAYQPLGDHVLTSLGADPQQLGNNPNRAAYVQQFIAQHSQDVTKAAQAIQTQSPAYQKDKETSQGALHIVPGYLDQSTGNYVAPTAVKSGPNGVSVVDLGGGGSKPAAGSVSPVQAQIDAVGQYRTPLQQVPAKLRGAVQAGLATQYPDNDQTQYNAKNKALTDYTSGTDHKTVVAIQTAYDHLDQLKVAAQALNSGNTVMFNQAKQAYETATGNSMPTTANAIKLVAADEVSKALTGASGGEGDRDKAQALLNVAGSPGQVADSIDAVRHLMQSKTGPLQDAAKAAGLTDKQTQSIFGSLYQVPGANGRVAGNTPTPPPAAAPKTPAATSSIPVGTVRGKFQFIGGDPSAQSSWKQI
jgi:hypothetical protein